jgi:hypothetical protein
MMANAARDPFFLAAMAAEAAAWPEKRAEIEAKCLRCHAPMAHEEIARHGGTIGADLLRIDTRWAALARDGASCTVCHRIRPDELGTPASFNGGWRINDADEIYGPHEDVFGLPMHNVTGFWPVHGAHVLKSELCATCHTLFVDTESGHVLPEQTPFLEWRNSSFAPERTCQGCHLPQESETGAPITTRIAREPTGADFEMIEPRRPFGRHLLVGGNTLLPAILRDHAEELRVAAPAEAFDAVIAAARTQLQERTARLEIGGIVKGAEFTVRVRNLAGHKLPTAHPSRRLWLHVRVRAARTGAVLFESGAFDERGRILGPDSAPLPGEAAGGPVLPHVREVTAPEQVPVYEAVLRGADGEPTFLALQSAGFLKDNRLLPDGWRADGPDAVHTAPVGVGGDEDFTGGGDAVIYMVTVPESARGEYVIEARLLYQVLAPRFAAELFRTDHEAVAAFRRMYEAADPRPEVVASATLRVTR